MGIVALGVSLFLLLFNIFFNRRKNKLFSPIILFFALWSFVLFLSVLNWYNIYKPSNEAYFLIILMLVFFALGVFLDRFLTSKQINLKIKLPQIKLKEQRKGKKDFKLRLKLFYVLCFFIILFNLIDLVLIVKELSAGTPMWQIRNWTLEPYGSSNPILDRRSFLEDAFRSIILTPFATIIPPIVAYYFFGTNNTKQKYKLLIISLIVLVTSSLAGGGGRLGFIYYIGSFLLAFFVSYKQRKISQNDIKRYKKFILLVLVFGILAVVAFTTFRTGFGNLIKQVYTYFALPPTLLSLWLPDLKNITHTYGMLSTFGIHSYFFRVLDTIGLDFLIPSVYNTAFDHLLNAEMFKNVGYGQANAFVTPIYYFFIDGGYPFVCLASFFFGYIVQNIYKRLKKNIDIRNFVIYILVIYGVFLTFIRLQTTIPAYIISYIFVFILLRRSKQKKEEENKFEYKKKIDKIDLISVIVPIYKVENYLEKCIISILNQTYSRLEIILVDDGSPDKCGIICDEFKEKDSRIKVIHKENGGLSDARNVGIQNSTGKYITFIDSDDYVEKEYIDLLYTTLISNNADISIASHRVLYKKKSIDKSTGDKFCGNSEMILEKILYDDGVDLSAWGKLYKTKLFNQIKFPKGRLFEDSATTYQLIDLSEKIAVYSKPVYNYVMRDDSISRNQFSKKKLDLITSTEEMTDFIQKKYPELEKACNRRLMYAYLSTLTQLSKSKKPDKEIKEQLITYIKNNKKSVLKDRRIPKRDRIGIYSALLGLNFYRFTWNIYSKITGRI